MHAPVLLFAALMSGGLPAQAPAPPPPATQAAPPPTQGAPAAPDPKTVPPDTKAPPEKGQPPEAKATDTTQPQAGTKPGAPSGDSRPTAGQGHPPVVVPATEDTASVRVQIALDGSAEPTKDDFKAGLLVSAQSPDLRIVPTIDVTSNLAGQKGSVNIDLLVKGLSPFGEMTVPLHYRGRQVETLRFHKVGLVVKPPPDGVIVAQEKQRRLSESGCGSRRPTSAP
jgi:hypothetical protein